MKGTKLIGAGSAVLVAGLALIAFAFAPVGSSSVLAGNGCVTPQPSPTPQGSVILGEGVNSLGEQCPTATPTVPRRTVTPEPTTRIAEPTDEAPTTVPSTPAVPPTTAPPTATPSGGAGGGGIAPPNTGDGSAAGTSGTAWLVAAGALLAMTGGGLALAGAKRRR